MKNGEGEVKLVPEEGEAGMGGSGYWLVARGQKLGGRLQRGGSQQCSVCPAHWTTLAQAQGSNRASTANQGTSARAPTSLDTSCGVVASGNSAVQIEGISARL